MSHFYKGLWNTIIVIAMLVLTFSSTYAQLSLVSSTPEDGDAGVSTLITFQFVFNAALDTSVIFQNDDDRDYDDQIEKDDFSFLQIEIFPEDSVGEPDSMSISADLTTVTAHGVELAEDTRFIIFLTNAKAQNGDDLDIPYIITFTTASTLPEGTVTGEVTFPGGDPSGAVVGLLGKDFMGDELFGLAVVNSPYGIRFVPDGTYFPISIKDTNGDENLDFDGDALGFYDPDNNGVADSIVVTNGDSLPNIDIELAISGPKTARVPHESINEAALVWAPDGVLVAVSAEDISPQGETFYWNYLYYSSAFEEFRLFLSLGNSIISTELGDDEDDGFQNEEDQPDTTALPLEWMDSDSAAAIAEANGGVEFRDDFTDVEVDGGLFSISDSEGDSLQNKNVSRRGQFEIRKDALLTMLANGAGNNEVEAVWFFYYFSGEDGNGFEIAIDALTGEVLRSSEPSTARERMDIVVEEAIAWSSDAELIFVETCNIDSSGEAVDWLFKYLSFSKNIVLVIETSGSEIFTYEISSGDIPPYQPLPSDWIDSPDAMIVADANSDNFRETYEESSVCAFLEQEDYEGARATWWFEYETSEAPTAWLRIGVDALTGELLEIYGPLAIEASSPANGELNVSGITDFEFTFNAAIDTSYRFSDDSFIDFQIFPIGKAGEPSETELSGDMKTVILKNIPLTDNTRFFGILTGAQGQQGQSLDRAHVLTFSTGDTLPPGQILGEITSEYGDNNYEGTFVLLFEAGVFPNNLKGIGVANSPYSIDYIPDGTYLPVAFNPNSQEGPLLGYPDPDKDGVPDSVVIAGGNTIDDVDIELMEPERQTAREQINLVEQTARNWAPDAVLVTLASGPIDPVGHSVEWIYLFYSESLADFIAFGAFSNIIIFADVDLSFPYITPIPPNWIDSDSAASVAELNVGAEFRDLHPDADVFCFLGSQEINSDTSGSIKITFDSPIPLLSDKEWHISNGLERVWDDQVAAVWVFLYFSYDNSGFIEIYIDALTGEVLFVQQPFTALEGWPRANEEASQVAADAQLLNVSSQSMGPDGKAHEWRYTYYSVSEDSLYIVMVFADMSVYTDGLGEEMQPPSTEPLPDEWNDSPEVMAVAEGIGDDFLNQNRDAYIEAFLSRGLHSDDPDLPVWLIRYFSYSSMDSLSILINAETAELISDVQVAVNNVPESFALKQNYPNPFNPQTTIEYQLPKISHVSLVIYNMLGQTVRTLIDETQLAGFYKVSWDGENQQGISLTSGVYIFRLRTKEFTRTRKMIFLK